MESGGKLVELEIDGFTDVRRVTRDEHLTIRELMERYDIDPFMNYSPGDPQYRVLFGEGRPSEEPFKHTFQARYHYEEDVIFIAETYEGRKAGFHLDEHEKRLRDMGAAPDPDFVYAWSMPYSAANWAAAMLFVRDTDCLLEPMRALYGMCWHCGVIVRGASCPYCGRRVQAWYNTSLQVETGELANVGVLSAVGE